MSQAHQTEDEKYAEMKATIREELKQLREKVISNKLRFTGYKQVAVHSQTYYFPISLPMHTQTHTHTQVLSHIAHNEQVTDIEKLERHEFILDIEEHQRHKVKRKRGRERERESNSETHSSLSTSLMQCNLAIVFAF